MTTYGQFIPRDAATVQVYVSQANGDDTNSGLASTESIATAQSYIDKFPKGAPWPVIFHFDTGDHVEFRFNAGWGALFPIFMFGDGAGQGIDDGFVETRAEDTSLGGTTEQIIVTSGSVTTALVGSTIQVTSGVCDGALRHINNVVGDNIYVGRFLDGFVTGDTFRIVRAGAVVEFVSNSEVIATSIGATKNDFNSTNQPDLEVCLCVVNMRWNTAQPAPALQINNSTVVAFGLEVDGDNARVFENSTIFAATRWLASFVEDPYQDLIPFFVEGNATYPTNTAEMFLLWTGWGMASFNLFGGGIRHFSGYITQPHGDRMKIQETAKAFIQGGSGGFYATYGATTRLNCTNSEDSWYDTRSDGQSNIIVEGANTSMIISGNDIEIVNTAEFVISIFRGGSLFLSGASLIESTSTHAIDVASLGSLIVQGGNLLVQGSTPGVNDVQINTRNASPLDVSFTTDLNTAGVGFLQGGCACIRES